MHVHLGREGSREEERKASSHNVHTQSNPSCHPPPPPPPWDEPHPIIPYTSPSDKSCTHLHTLTPSHTLILSPFHTHHHIPSPRHTLSPLHSISLHSYHFTHHITFSLIHTVTTPSLHPPHSPPTLSPHSARGHQCGVRVEGQELFSLVHERVDEVGIVGQAVREAGVDNLQHHYKNLLQNRLVHRLYKARERGRNIKSETGLINVIYHIHSRLNVAVTSYTTRQIIMN